MPTYRSTMAIYIGSTNGAQRT